jgi:hypothetical protein
MRLFGSLCPCLLVTLCACGDDGSAGKPDVAPPPPGDGGSDDDAASDALAPRFLLEVSPSEAVARQHLGGPGEPTLVFTFHVPATLQGGGLPADLQSGAEDLAVAEVELPQGGGSTDEHAANSVGVVNLDAPRFCLVGGPSCDAASQDGYWQAQVRTADGGSREVQLGMAMQDVIRVNGVYRPVFGVFLPPGDALAAGERLELRYRGKMSGRATDWTDQPLLANFRYRSFAADGTPGAWTVLDDAQVQPLQITPAGAAHYVRVLMPMDVQVDVPFTIAVVATDHYGNPAGVEGTVQLDGALTAELPMGGQWRKEVPGVVVHQPGLLTITPHLAGARGIHHYAMASAGPPSERRLVGDLHSHSGDGGAQRKFLGAFLAGDHKGLFTRTHDALRYMREVAGFDFGAVSEHSVRQDSYTPPPAVAADAAFQTGGACAGAGTPIPALGSWWPRHQAIVADFAAAASDFVAFPAFEWHASHATATDRSPLHRIVLFRDFAAAGESLPILPGDVENLPPQCIVRFLDDAGFGPARALVVPHMMKANDTNIDWDLTYADSTVAPRALTDRYYRVGEIYSARAIDQQRAVGQATLTVFEVADRLGGRWAYRYGWRQLGVHIGIIGSSDNHEQMPGVNDDLDLDGVNYHSNEPGGYAVVLAEGSGRAAIFDALSARRSYATSGIRAWLHYRLGDARMGAITTATAASLPAEITLAAGMTITTVELWAAQVGGAPGYQLIQRDTPLAETYHATLDVPNPLPAGGPPAEWLYYVRAFFQTPGSPNDADEAVWSSPIWVGWQ